MKTETNVSNIKTWRNNSLENLPNEIWKPVVGFEGFYEVSNYGRIKSIDDIPESTLKKRDSPITRPLIRLQNLNIQGYPYITFTQGLFKCKSCLTHRVVAEAFIPNPENKPQVNHINFDTTDSRVSNLEWCTPKENIRHSIEHGRRFGKNKKYKKFNIKNPEETRKNTEIISKSGKRFMNRKNRDLQIKFVNKLNNQKIFMDFKPQPTKQ